MQLLQLNSLTVNHALLATTSLEVFILLMLEGHLYANDWDRDTMGKYLQAALFSQHKQLSVSTVCY